MTFDVRYRFYERLAYLRWVGEWGAMWRSIGWTFAGDCMRQRSVDVRRNPASRP